MRPLGDHPAPVAVHLEGDDRVREADAIVVEEHDRVEEGVRQPRIVERLVGVGHVDTLLEEPRRQVLAGLAVAHDLERRLGRLPPDVGPAARPPPRPRFHLVVGQHAERGNDVRGEVLVLVVTPDDHHVGPEVVEDLPRLAEVVEQGVAMAGRARGAAVGPVLGAHRGRPARGISVALGQAGILEDPAKDAGHVLVQTGEWRVVRHAQPENLAHERIPPRRGATAWATLVPLPGACQIRAIGRFSATARRSRRW